MLSWEREHLCSLRFLSTRFGSTFTYSEVASKYDAGGELNYAFCGYAALMCGKALPSGVSLLFSGGYAANQRRSREREKKFTPGEP